MDTSTDQYQSHVNRPDRFLAVLKTLLHIVEWPIGFFTLTDAERSKAGIYLGGEGRGD
jgi:hypothetical protein